MTELDLSETQWRFDVTWFNPRAGGDLQLGSVHSVAGGGKVKLGLAPIDQHEDWLVLIRRPR